MSDKRYRELVDDTSLHHDFFINTIKPNLRTDYYQQLLWLRLLGLMETWGMIK